MLNGMNIETGIDLDEVINIGNWICEKLDRENQSKVGLAI
jgi:hydroxymethylglutaryl-CoA lyase